MSDPDPIAANPIAAALDNPQPAPQVAQPGDAGAEIGQGQYERPPFPAGCPVKPLGISSGLDGTQKCFYFNWNGQIVGLEAGNRHGKNSLIALFGPASDWLEAQWPQWSKPVREYNKAEKRWETVKDAEIVGFDQAEASRALIEECVRKGIFDPSGKLRGAGAHRQRDNGLVLHCGDKIYASIHTLDGRIKEWRWFDPGVHGGYVYSAAAPIPRPHHDHASPRAAELVLRTLRTWNWKRPLLDPRLALGAIGASLIGGALPWRPNMWITGARGTGKSTFNGQDGFLHQIFRDGVFRTGNASSAAVRQSLQNSTVPVMFDEIEPGADNRRVTEVIELARVASSGDKIHRGGQDHQAHEFTLASCFWFSSINIPPLQPQDRSRLAILELLPFAHGSVPPDLQALGLPQLGRELLRRMVDGWERLAATKLKYHAALSAAGHDSRACDQFGMLLACADVLIYDWDTDDGLPDDEDVALWTGECRPDRLAEIRDTISDDQACVVHILTSMVQARGGDEREMLSSWIGRAVASVIDPLFEGVQPGVPDKSNDRLQQIGLKLVNAKYHPEECDLDGQVTKAARWGSELFNSNEPGFLAIAGSHQGLAKLFEGTKWQGGVWRQSLARCEGALDGVKVKFGKMGAWAVLVPLHHVLDETELPAASRPDAMADWIRAQEKGGAA